MAKDFAGLARNKVCVLRCKLLCVNRAPEAAMTPERVIQRVLAKAGGPTAVATLLGPPIKRQNVEYWVRVSDIPAEHCPALERALGIPCQQLRGDLIWVRVPDPDWPDGKPLLDVAAVA
jgi:DNA-binding transcriptional regulator YdaS (Cro superfamily)